MISLKTLSKEVAKEKRKIKFISTFGYLYPIVILLFIILIIGFLILLIANRTGGTRLLIKLVIIMCIFSFYILKAFFVKIKQSDNKSILPDKYRLKFQNSFKAYFKDLKISHIEFNNDLNASITQIPTGIFGGYQNRVQIGLPLMMTLSKAELATVLLHELGHIQGDHGKSGHKEYLRYQRYERIYAVLAEKAGILAKFYNWYFPYYSRVSFSLRRLNEFEADSYAVLKTDKQLFGRTLFKIAAIDELFNGQYFGSVWSKTKEDKNPPKNVYSYFIKNRAQVEEKQAELLQKMAMDNFENDQETEFDSHPSTKARLNAIGYELEPWTISEKAAIEEVFSEHETLEIMDIVNSQWLDSVKADWKDQYEYYQEAKKTIENFESKGFENLNKGEAIDYLDKKILFSDQEESKQLYENIFHKFDWSIAAYNLAFIEIHQQNYAKSFEYFNIALNARPTLFENCHHEISFLCSKIYPDDPEEADVQYQKLYTAFCELNQVSAQDQLNPAKISNLNNEYFLDFFQTRPEVKALYLAEKPGKDEDEFISIIGIDYNRYHNNVPISEKKWEDKFHSEFAIKYPQFKNGIIIFFNGLDDKTKDWTNLANQENLFYKNQKKKGWFSGK
ncbi:MAG: M48 family metalloprotease [Halobacteriovoraceae bacterium]|jgi:Zn-dependent protease with chaperone function|nr:M48 family metalloprotease [Halobacteriovoraceae bacterium]